MSESPKVSPWPYVAAFAIALVVALATFAILVFAPSTAVDHAIEKIGSGLAIVLADPTGFAESVVVLLGVAVAIWAGGKALLHTEAPAPRPRAGSSSGGAAALVLVILAAASSSACGASAVRTHATIAHGLHRGVELAGDGIREATHAALDACPHDDGAERTQCIDRIEREATAAGALRDAMIAPTNTYRALALDACGIDPAHPPATAPEDCPDAPPEVLHQLELAKATALHDAPAFVAALVALGAPIDPALFGGE